MNKKNRFLAIAIISTLLTACQAVPKNSKAEPISTNEKSTLKLRVFQDGTEMPINTTSATINIDKAPFSLRFHNQRYNSQRKEFHAARIVALLNKADLDSIKMGKSSAELPLFRAGMGLAGYNNKQYESLFFNRGHHYAFYENFYHRRLDLLYNAGKFLELEFKINNLNYNNKKVPMVNTELDEFYVAFWLDKNFNEILDQGEFHKLTIKLRDRN